MRVFVTGASGHIASAVIPELLAAGHQVTGLARSGTATAAVTGLGAEVHRGSFDDLDSLRAGARAAGAVIHLAFDHDAVFAGDYAGAVATDLDVVAALGEALAGTGKTFIGIGLTPVGDRDAAIRANPRAAIPLAITGYGRRGVRTILVAVPPVTHSERDRRGFVPALITFARDTGVSGYVGDGTNRWPAGHVLDIARLFRIALDKAPSGSQLYAATEEGVPLRLIAETIARHLGVPAVSIAPEDVAGHFKNFPFVSADLTMPNAATRELLSWTPAHPGLIADLDQGHYFTTSAG
jgi:nucleoside-diphosphate-sugar epimerase